MNTPVPNRKFPEKPIGFALNDSRLIKVTDIDHVPYYHNSGIKGAVTECYMHTEVYDRLKKAQTYLPCGYSFRIYDAWRPFEVQLSLYNDYRAKVIRENPNADTQTVDDLTKLFVSKPIRDVYDGPVHATGGAIDLTIVDSNGKELDMGTEFDFFGEKANTAYFEINDISADIRSNRRLLYNSMTHAGFTNLPTEWWHYDYGNKFWAYYNNVSALFGCVFDI